MRVKVDERQILYLQPASHRCAGHAVPRQYQWEALACYSIGNGPGDPPHHLKAASNPALIVVHLLYQQIDCNTQVLELSLDSGGPNAMQTIADTIVP